MVGRKPYGGRLLAELPAFAHFYPWCTPERFRALNYRDYLLLRSFMEQMNKPDG